MGQHKYRQMSEPEREYSGLLRKLVTLPRAGGPRLVSWLGRNTLSRTGYRELVKLLGDGNAFQDGFAADRAEWITRAIQHSGSEHAGSRDLERIRRGKFTTHAVKHAIALVTKPA